VSEKNEAPLCFVIQPFDEGGTYDLRYKETIRPAIEKAGLNPKRADEILGVNPVIEKIESAIASSPICVAEVTEDNPNVWLELGYALALGRPTVIICEKKLRPKLPFDVQHRSIIFYRTDSRSGFDELEKSIIRLVRHEIETAKKIEKVPVLKKSDIDKVDLKEFEVAILTTIFSFSTNLLGGAQIWDLEKKMQEIGYVDVGLALGIVNLREKEFISESVEWIQDGGNSYETKVYRTENPGIQWIQANQDSLELTFSPVSATKVDTDFDDEIPF